MALQTDPVQYAEYKGVYHYQRKSLTITKLEIQTTCRIPPGALDPKSF